MQLEAQKRLDQIGTWLSLGCAVHCMLLPLILTFLPLLGLGYIADAHLERLILVVSVVLASLSLCWGTRVHREYRILFFLAAGIALVYASGAFTSHHHEELGSSFVSALAGLCFAAGHLLNMRLCRSCHSCASHESEH